MEHQYPGAISGDENMLAELMLPDQVHNRKEDWTVFFLHKDTSEEGGTEGEDAEKKVAMENNSESADGAQIITDVESEANRAEAGGDEEEEEDDAEGGEGPPLIYVLNLVNTKHDASAKRCVSPL